MPAAHRWLIGPEAKLERAIEHLEPLKRECQRFLLTKPYAVSTKFETDAGCYVARFRIRKQMPLRASILVGELIHNLRSALDQVAWVLAASHTDDVESLWTPDIRRRITFPIAKKPEAFRDHSLMPFISEDAKAALKGMQPYQRGHPQQIAMHPLVALHELWNVDKHVVVHSGVGHIDLSTVSWVPKALDVEELLGGREVELVEQEGPLKDGAPVAYIRFLAVNDPPGTTKVDMKGQPAVRIVFGSGAFAVPADGLEGFCAYVADLLNEVSPVFPAP